jgi:hypothetical protein
MLGLCREEAFRESGSGAGDVQYLADPKSASTTMKMPRQYVSIAATYVN